MSLMPKTLQAAQLRLLDQLGLTLRRWYPELDTPDEPPGGGCAAARRARVVGRERHAC
jgi:hypothetical protein